MKKLVGVVFAMMMVGALLAGCYSKTCDQPQPVSYKGENK
jgi:hypothetical protein